MVTQVALTNLHGSHNKSNLERERDCFHDEGDRVEGTEEKNKTGNNQNKLKMQETVINFKKRENKINSGSSSILAINSTHSHIHYINEFWTLKILPSTLLCTLII